MKQIVEYYIGTMCDMVIPIPEGYKVLHVGERENETFLWAEVDYDNPVVNIEVKLVGTNTFVEDNMEYIDSIHMSPGLIWHVYLVR